MFKFSGRIAEDDLRHSMQESAPDGSLVAPTYVASTWGTVPKYGDTVQTKGTGYDPAGDCNGNFMSDGFQPNNNCYAYGCNITPNSFPQPGRASGAPNLWDNFTPQQVSDNAVSDGLVFVGTTMAELMSHADATDQSTGHYVALMFSPPESAIGGDPDANWPGDYHWARCDSLSPMSWSQKDGSDQVTNFDFAGQPITDPSVANWRVNQGPIGGTSKDANEYRVTYGFYCFMFVPYGTPVTIL